MNLIMEDDGFLFLTSSFTKVRYLRIWIEIPPSRLIGNRERNMTSELISSFLSGNSAAIGMVPAVPNMPVMYLDVLCIIILFFQEPGFRFILNFANLT